MKRTDIHSPSAIVPADYTFVLDYAFPRELQPAIGLDCTVPTYVGGVEYTTKRPHVGDRCCLARLRQTATRWAAHGGPGKCTVCGAHFSYGEVWKHEPSGELVHLGHDCAAKYEMMHDRELELGRAKAATAAAIERARKAEAREAFLAKHPGLAEDLDGDHHILADLKRRFVEWCELSDKQVALARKLAHELRNPPPAEANVLAPEGKVEFCGEVVSKKLHEGSCGATVKITVKVREPGGVWLAWMTCPGGEDIERGMVLQFSATLTRGRDEHFAFGKRPIAMRPWVRESPKFAKAREEQRKAGRAVALALDAWARACDELRHQRRAKARQAAECFGGYARGFLVAYAADVKPARREQHRAACDAVRYCLCDYARRLNRAKGRRVRAA